MPIQAINGFLILIQKNMQHYVANMENPQNMIFRNGFFFYSVQHLRLICFITQIPHTNFWAFIIRHRTCFNRLQGNSSREPSNLPPAPCVARTTDSALAHTSECLLATDWPSKAIQTNQEPGACKRNPVDAPFYCDRV